MKAKLMRRAIIKYKMYKRNLTFLKNRSIKDILDTQIQEVRECLNEMVICDKYSFEEILNVSQQLDCLIVQYLKETSM